MTIPEIDLKLKTIKIEGGCIKKMTVRNMFYVGFFGKIEIICYWLKYHRKTPFKDYLEFQVTYAPEKQNGLGMYYYQDIDAEKEKIKL